MSKKQRNWASLSDSWFNVSWLNGGLYTDRTAPSATFTGRTQRPPRNSFKKTLVTLLKIIRKDNLGGTGLYCCKGMFCLCIFDTKVAGEKKENTRTSRDVGLLRHVGDWGNDPTVNIEPSDTIGN